MSVVTQYFNPTKISAPTLARLKATGINLDTHVCNITSALRNRGESSLANILIQELVESSLEEQE